MPSAEIEVVPPADWQNHHRCFAPVSVVQALFFGCYLGCPFYLLETQDA
jgi:hypothetical protein